MKGTILAIVLLMSGIFAGAFALADDTSTATVENVEDTAVTGVTSGDVTTATQDIKDPKGHKKIGFVKVIRGTGWIENGQDGTLITGFWASQKFAKTNDNSNKTVVAKHLGMIRIDGVGNYKLVKVNETETTEDKVSFYLIALGKKDYQSDTTSVDISSASANSVGILTLTRDKNLKNLNTWQGSITLNEGKYAGTWNVVLGTSSKVMNPQKMMKSDEGKRNIATGENSNTTTTEKPKVGFFKRVQFWKK